MFAIPIIIRYYKMEGRKTEEYYYLKVVPTLPSKLFHSPLPHIQRYAQIDFQYPPYLSVSKVPNKSKKDRLLLDTQTTYSQFYEIIRQKSLTKTQLESTLIMKMSQEIGQYQNTVNTFEIKLSDFMKNSENKQNFTDKHIISSKDSTSLMEITVIPSFNPLSYPILEKIMSHEDSTLTVDSSSRLENLPTQQSLGNLQRKGKFKRSVQSQLKSDKRSKPTNQGVQIQYVKGLHLKEVSPYSPKERKSALKRCQMMRRSQLIPQQFHCEMEEIDEHQTWQQYEKHASTIAYIFALILQVAMVVWLMTPSSKI